MTDNSVQATACSNRLQTPGGACYPCPLPPPHRLECPDLKVPVRLQVFEVTAYFERDSFRGYVVALKEEGGAEGLLYEVFVERRSNLVVGSQEGDVAQRLLNIDVSHMVVCDGHMVVK